MSYLNTAGGEPAGPQFCDGWGYLLSIVAIYSDVSILVLTLQNALTIFCPQLVKGYLIPIPSFRVMYQNLGRIIVGKRGIFEKGFTYHEHPTTEIIYEGGLYRYRKYIFWITLAVGALAPALAFIDYGHYTNDNLCGFPIQPLWKRIVVIYGIKYFNIIFIITIYTSIMIYLRFNLYKIHKAKSSVIQSANNPESDSDLRVTLQKELLDLSADDDARRRQVMMRELKTFAIYPLGYVLMWTVPVIVQVYNYTAHNAKVVPKPFGLILAFSIMLPLNCTVDTIIFLIREKPWAVTEKRLNRKPSMDQFGNKLASELQDILDIGNAHSFLKGETNDRQESVAMSMNGQTLVSASRQSSVVADSSIRPMFAGSLSPVRDVDGNASKTKTEFSDDEDNKDDADDNNNDHYEMIDFLKRTGP
jgi:hypothetical protein